MGRDEEGPSPVGFLPNPGPQSNPEQNVRRILSHVLQGSRPVCLKPVNIMETKGKPSWENGVSPEKPEKAGSLHTTCPGWDGILGQQKAQSKEGN